MATKYDAEDLLETVKTIMTTNLNAKITAIEAEKIAAGKGVSPTLKTIDSTAYYLQTWADKMLLTTPSIFYGIEDVQANSVGNAVAKTYKIFCEIVLVDSGMTNDGAKRVMRYARALEEIFADAFAPAVGFGQVKVESVRPMAFKLELDSDEEIKVGGVSLTIGMA